MSTLLIVNENALVPMGADVAGIGIPAHTHVIKTDGNRIYIDNDVTQTLTSGVNIKISWKSMKVSLSGSVSSDINVGAFIGFYTQDDADVFQRAVNAMNDGKGGNVYVPGGVYYLGHMVVTRPRSSFVVASSVQFIHGSASIDSDNGGSPYSQYNLYSSAHTQQPVVMNISQNIYKTNVPSIQGQALSITQMNSNCVHDLDVWGCGELGEEIHQSAAANVRRGQLWAYHSTAYASVGQLLHWTGAELEYENNSGWYGAFSGNPLLPGQNGLHIDDIGDTPNTNALEPAGAWHVGVACDGNIMDWCVEMGAGRNSNQQGLPSAGIDSAGRVFGNRFIASVPGPDTFDSIGVVTAETRYAQMASDGAVSGQIFNAGTLENITAGVSSVDIVDGGMFNAPVSLVVGAPPVSGVQAALSVDTYALRAVQGGIAINATTRGNAPDGVESGMVFDLPGGECRVQPQVVYDGARFAIRQGGECARLPDATIPLGMERTRLTLRYVSGGSGKPQTLPIIEPLYGVRTVSVRESGAGYNIAPGVLAITDHVDNKWRGIIYTPVKMNVHLNAHPRANAIHVGSSLMSSELPLRCSPGDLVYVPDGRNAGESSGTGALAYCNNRNVWMVNGQPVRH
ncbi:hypothetical protein [Acetobacter estunensis]|uniref:hypothetical protein n=1 Tax=Acetobacter estunensis TaxID=104097 RepID=UPI001C2DD5C6|nr:hypothetical protein [Acetobacter estunensis]MBV1838483.1 hypothetical protein [Acetobacter estunensis]